MRNDCLEWIIINQIYCTVGYDTLLCAVETQIDDLPIWIRHSVVGKRSTQTH